MSRFLSSVFCKSPEKAACDLKSIKYKCFNQGANIPYGCTVDYIYESMCDFLVFLELINKRLGQKKIQRIENIVMPANFSSMVGEFMSNRIPEYCDSLVKNSYHNGHPDLIPRNTYKNNAVLYGEEGIEIKSSRYFRSWQGHNPENSWVMVFVFDSNRPSDKGKKVAPKPFEFKMVAGARLFKSDWNYSGRAHNSRRTITASINKHGRKKIMDNWIYKA